MYKAKGPLLMRRFAITVAFALLTLTLTLTLTLARAARAEADADPLVRDGIARFERGDYPAARADFAQAYARAPRPATLLDLALAELAAGAPLDALRHFRAYVADARASPEAAARVRDKMIPRAVAETGHIVVSAPRGAVVIVDGEAAAPGPIDVTAGRHAIELRLDGRTTRLDLVAPAGETLHVDMVTAGVGARP
jgi:hypothetical protein